MFKKMSFRATSLIVALVLALGSAVTAFAITIVVDGDQEAVWTTGSGGQTPGHMTTQDPNESAIVDSQDIKDVYWTNDSTNFYLMLQTYATPSLTGFPTATDVYFCIDTDNNPGTGGSYTNCNNMTGIDRTINIHATSSVTVYDGSFNPVGSGTLGYNTSATTPVIEVSVPLSTMGFNTATCTQNMAMAIFFDNGTTQADDNTPDTGTLSVGCGSPTAITLSDMSAASGTPYLPLALAGAAFVLVAGAGLVLRKRYMA